MTCHDVTRDRRRGGGAGRPRDRARRDGQRGARWRAVQHRAHVRSARRARSAFMGAVSDDRFGTMIAAQLVDDRVSTDLVQRVSVPTTLAAAELDAARRGHLPLLHGGDVGPGAATGRAPGRDRDAVRRRARVGARTDGRHGGRSGRRRRRRRDGDGRPQLPSRRDRRSRPVPRPGRRRARTGRRGEGQRRRPRVPLAGRSADRRGSPAAHSRTATPCCSRRADRTSPC